MTPAATMKALSILTYPFRLLCCAVLFYEPPCIGSLCARPRVGFSSWCRRHTDMILACQEPPWTKRALAARREAST